VSEVEALRGAVRGFLDKHAPVGSEDDVLTRLAQELGLVGLAVPEGQGGSGGSWNELGVALEETGRVLLRAPYVSAVVAASVVSDDLVPGLVDGSCRAALALDADVSVDGGRLEGTLPQVVDAPGADLLLVGVEDTLYAVEQPAVTPLRSLDPTRPQGRVALAGVSAGAVGDAVRARQLLHVALAAESVGAARRCLELTVQHLKTREQFGRPLGSFQALRHRVADMTVAVEGAASTAWLAARAVAADADDLPVLAPLAKAIAADAFTYVAGETIQLHGGIGFTWEHPAHLYFKRAWTTALLHGDSRTLRRAAYQLSLGS
jgi:alkylation response protein AidB-like acyl-CoA dehydrogenase